MRCGSMSDPLLTDRSPGIAGRAIMRIPAVLWSAFVVFILFIPLCIAYREFCPRAAWELIWEPFEDLWPALPAPPVLSPRAQKLYDRLLAGHWYSWGDDRTPKSMQELLDAGLVGTLGRVEKVRRCYVPAGSKPFQLEQLRP